MYPQISLVETLQRIPCFVDLNPNTLASLARICSIRQVPSGDDLFLEGGKEDYLYIVLEGQFNLDIHIPGSGRVVMYTSEPLDIVGWSSLTSVIRQRTSSAHAVCDSRVLAFDGPGLLHLCNEDFHLGYNIMRRIANTAASRMLTIRLKLLARLAEKSAQLELPEPDFE